MGLTQIEANRLMESALASAALLGLFLQGKWQLTEDQLDDNFDILIRLMEAARDDRWRCRA